MRAVYSLMIAAPVALGLVGCAGLAGWHMAEPVPAMPDRAERVEGHEFAGDLLVLIDADMPAYAYADGLLTPPPATGDALHLLTMGAEPRLGAAVSAGNTVTHWPVALAVAPDGRHAFVIEGRGPAPEGVDRVDDVQTALAPGSTLSVFAIGGDGDPDAVAQVATAAGPNNISVAPDGSALAVTTDTRTADLQIFPLEGGRPGAPLTVDFAIVQGIGRDAGSAMALAFSPDGDLIAINLGGGAVALAEVTRDGSGAITGAVLRGAPLVVGELLSQLAWAPDGQTVYALDTGWGPRRIDRLLNGAGAVHVLQRGAAGGLALVQSVATGLGSEAFALSPDGARLATLNMRRTYLPPGFPTGLIPGRGAASVSLFAVDPATGRLEALGDPVGFPGVLPQGIVFDAEGDDLAVTAFQDRDPASTQGWIGFLRIAGDGAAARLAISDIRVSTPRGAHALARVAR